MLPHAFGGTNHDDSVHVDAPTTTPTPQTSSPSCWRPPVLIWLCPKPLPTGGRWLSPGNLTRFPDKV
jgi:hypothetical protein